MKGALRNLLFYSGAGLVVSGAVLLFVGISILSFPPLCSIYGCPSTAIYWGEVYTGALMLVFGTGMMITSTISLRRQDLSSLGHDSEPGISPFFKATLLVTGVFGVAMVLLGIVSGLVTTTFSCQTDLPCWPPPGGPENVSLVLLGAYLSLFSLFIWRLRKGPFLP